MHIWVDADACPNVIKDILFRVAERMKIPLTLVANQFIRSPPSRYIKTIQVPKGFDAADHHIIQKIQSCDLVITADIPLAAEIVTQGAHALNPRGELYHQENIKEHLATRNFMEEIRSSGEITGGPAPLSQRDRQNFANALDRFLISAHSRQR